MAIQSIPSYYQGLVHLDSSRDSLQGEPEKPLRLMKILEDTEVSPSLQEIGKAFSAMTPTSRYRAFKMLYRLNGCTGDIVKDGAACLVRQPKSLLTRVTYHGQTMRIIDHLVVKAGNNPLCIDVGTNQPNWPAGTPRRAKEEIKTRLDTYSTKTWYRNTKESPRAREEAASLNQELRSFNQEIFLYVKNRAGVETPMEFIWPLQGNKSSEPKSISKKTLEFLPEEGQFYKIDQDVAKDGKPPLRKPGKQGDSVEECHHFGKAVKRIGNHLYLYLDGISRCGYLLINGARYEYDGLDRRKNKQPSYRFKEGDVVCSCHEHLFTVGKNGVILYPGNESQDYDRLPDAFNQSIQFAKDLAVRDTTNCLHYKYTMKARAAEIDAPLLPGFSFYSTLERNEKAAREAATFDNYGPKGNLLFIDVPNDPVLKSLIAYLEKEFELMDYTDAQKMTRIALLSANLIEDESAFPSPSNHRFGDVIQAGVAQGRHRAALVKTLCDAFKLPSALIFGLLDSKKDIVRNGTIVGHIPQEASVDHAWNIVTADGRQYLVDPMNACMFPLNEPPGTTMELKRELYTWYAIKETGENGQKIFGDALFAANMTWS